MVDYEIAVLFPSDRIFYCLWQCFSQVKISISVNEVSLQEVFEKLTEQTGYHFVYSNEMLQRTGKVSVDMQDCDLGQIMAVCLKNTGLWYRLEDNIIVISPKFRQPDVPQKKITLTGNVKDKEGRPLPGVTILLKGSAVGVVSDVDGNFTLTVPGGIGTDAWIFFVCGEENARSSLKRSASVTYCHAGRCVSNGRSYRYRLPGSQERENDRGGNHHLLRKT